VTWAGGWGVGEHATNRQAEKMRRTFQL